jgi:hypothetical protein
MNIIAFGTLALLGYWFLVWLMLWTFVWIIACVAIASTEYGKHMTFGSYLMLYLLPVSETGRALLRMRKKELLELNAEKRQ